MTARHPAGTREGGRFAPTTRPRAAVALTPQESPAPTGEGWERTEYPTGIVGYRRSFPVSKGGLATHTVSGAASNDRFGQAQVIGHGGIVIAHGDSLPGELHYRILIAPRAGTGELVKAIMVNWVEVETHQGAGWASAMYAAVREAHPDALIPAADVLEAPGRRLVRHYAGKYPTVHTGRFDAEGTIQPTSGPADPIYRIAIFGPLA